MQHLASMFTQNNWDAAQKLCNKFLWLKTDKVNGTITYHCKPCGFKQVRTQNSTGCPHRVLQRGACGVAECYCVACQLKYRDAGTVKDHDKTDKHDQAFQAEDHELWRPVSSWQACIWQHTAQHSSAWKTQGNRSLLTATD